MFDVEILVPLGFFAMIAYIAKLIGDTRIRRKALESAVSDEKAEAILNRQWAEPSTRSALKWGLVLFALGGGVLLVDLFQISFESPLAYSILLLATGVALLGYYLIEHGYQPPAPPSETAQDPSIPSSVREPER